MPPLLALIAGPGSESGGYTPGMTHIEASRHPELARLHVNLGNYAVIHSAVRAQAIRTGGQDSRLGEESRTGFYVPGRELVWDAHFALPKYVKDKTLALLRKRRRSLGLPV